MITKRNQENVSNQGIVLYTHNSYTNISGNIKTNFNERTNTLLYKNISLTLYSRKGRCWLCARDEQETGTDCYIDPAVLLSHLGWVAQPWVTEPWLYKYLMPTCFRCSPAYLHKCISWLTARSWVNIWQYLGGGLFFLVTLKNVNEKKIKMKHWLSISKNLIFFPSFWTFFIFLGKQFFYLLV